MAGSLSTPDRGDGPGATPRTTPSRSGSISSRALTSSRLHRRARAAALGWTLIAAACSGDSGGGPETTASTATTGGPTTSFAAGSPEPFVAWELDGAGTPVVGKVELEFDGSYEFGSESVAFDGVTGAANSAAPGLIDTTKSFSVAAWVSLDHAADHHVTAVSQIGEVAAAFYLAFGEGHWYFGMKNADSPGGNVRARKAHRVPDPESWVSLMGVYDDDEHEVRLYVDGEWADAQPFTAEWQAAGSLTVGRSQGDGAPGDFWPGAIADVRIYPVALEDTEVEAVLNVGKPTSPPPALAPVPDGFHCPPGGGLCLGPLPAGTYTTQVFSPSITYTVPDGWTNMEDLLGNFLLQIEGDPRFLGIYRNVGAPLGCQEQPDTNVSLYVDDLSTWLTAHPGLIATEPQPVAVGGLQGVFIDVFHDPSGTKTCVGGPPGVPHIVGAGPSSLTHVLLPGMKERLYLLEYDRGNVTIEVGPEGASLEEYLPAVIPIVESLRFGS
jgi:hypothetical protein